MTLILTVNGHKSIWLLADRRLSSKGRAFKDDARKVMFLETTDAVAILGYAGLGATAHGTEPSDWMSDVLRGRNLTLEQSLNVLADAIKSQFPQHMGRMSGPCEPAHDVLITALLSNEVRLYTIGLVLAPDRKNPQFRYTRLVYEKPTMVMARTPPWCMGGSGGHYLNRDMKWKRPLLRLVRAYDRGQISAYTVADHLASLNYEVHLGVSDKSVGPRCIVAWRNSKNSIYKGGGGQYFYTGNKRDDNSPSLPIIGNGTDISALCAVIMPQMRTMCEAMLAGEPMENLDKDKLNAELARLPDKPSETLR